MATLEQYAEILNSDNSDEAEPQLSPVNLLNILALVAAHPTNNEWFFDDKQRISSYLQLAKRNLGGFNANQLLTLMSGIGRFIPPEGQVQDGGLKAAFFFDWEKELSSKLEGEQKPETIALLRTYLRLNADVPTQIFERWCVLACDSVAEWKLGDMATVIEYLARLKLRPTDEFIEVYTKRLVHLNQTDVPQLVRIIYACGKLSISNKRLRAAGTAILRDYATYGFDGTCPEDMVRLLEGLAKQRLRGLSALPQCSEFMEKHWFPRITEHMKHLDDRALVGTAWSLKRLNIPVEEQSDFRQQWYSNVVRRISEFRPRDLFIALESSEYLGFRSERGLEHFVGVWIERALQQFDHFWHHELAQVVTVLQHLLHTHHTQAETAEAKILSTDFKKHWQEACLKKLDEMYTQDLVVVLTSFVSLDEKVVESDLSKALVAAITDQLLHRHSDITPSMSKLVSEAFTHMPQIEMDANLRTLLKRKAWTHEH